MGAPWPRRLSRDRGGLQHEHEHLLLTRCAPREVLLVALALCVRQVVALGRVQREAQLALESAQVILHEVRICSPT
jgi:hypothetical protein